MKNQVADVGGENSATAGWTLRRGGGACWRALGLSACAGLVLMLVGEPAARAQVCGVTYIGSGSPTELIEVDTSTNPWNFIPIGDDGVAYNAMAYRPANNTLYAFLGNANAPNTLITIDAMDGSVNILGTVSGLPTNSCCYNAAAFAPDGLMYVRAPFTPTTMFAVNVDTLSATTINLSQQAAVGDWAWFDGLFYGVDFSGLVSIDTSGTVNVIGSPVGGFGAMFPASNGVFGLRNTDGAIFQFDITTGAVTQIAQGDPTENVDGARCFEAPLELEADLSVTKDDGSDTYLPGTDVVYTIVVTNHGPFGVQNAAVEDPLPDGITDASWTCTGGANGGVCGAPGGSGPIVDTPDLPVDATVTYELTITVPGDYSGDLVNAVTVELPEGFIDPSPDNNTATDTDVSELEPGISVEKSAEGPEPLEVGATIEYSFLVTNVGNVTLTAIEVTDPLVSPIDCPQTELEPKADMTCTGSYTVTQADVDAGVIENTATVTGDPPVGPPVTDEDTEVFPPDQAPGISIEKSGSGPDPLTVGATIEYEFLVTNTGNVTLTDVTVTDPLPDLSPISCPETTLAPGAEMTCTANYTVTQADVDAGVIENTATVTGDPPVGPPVTDDDTEVFPPDQAPGISIEKSGSGPDPLTVGATVEYEFLVTNVGNVTLTEVTVEDPLDGLSPIACPGTTLAPGAEMTCTATYTVTQADVDAGVVQNTATVTGQTPDGGPPATAEDTAQVPPVPPVPALPPLAFVLLLALLATGTLWTLRRARA